MIKLDFFSSQNCPFRTSKKKIADSLFGAWSFIVIHIHFTSSEGPKAL